MINVTKSFMPPIDEYEEKIKHIWENGILTNNGPYLRELKDKIENKLNINNLSIVTNGTIAIQLALNSLNIVDGEIITTPFSFVATTSAPMWERCTPVFVDINKDTLCIDVDEIEKAITPKTKAIIAVHVFGYNCDVERIEEIANKHNLKVIYDGAHAFASEYKGKSLLTFGDVTTCSFHATKVFHTIEGGACIANDTKVYEKLEAIKSFGSVNGENIYVGINGKMSEFNAAMGLCNIKYIDKIIVERKRVCDLYDKLLVGYIQKPIADKNLKFNYAYYPAIFKSEEELLRVIKKLNDNEINPRRYFYPSINNMKFLDKKVSCPISEDISSRIICLPLYVDLSNEDVIRICKIIKETIDKGE